MHTDVLNLSAETAVLQLTLPRNPRPVQTERDESQPTRFDEMVGRARAEREKEKEKEPAQDAPPEAQKSDEKKIAEETASSPQKEAGAEKRETARSVKDGPSAPARDAVTPRLAAAEKTGAGTEAETGAGTEKAGKGRAASLRADEKAGTKNPEKKTADKTAAGKAGRTADTADGVAQADNAARLSAAAPQDFAGAARSADDGEADLRSAASGGRGTETDAALNAGAEISPRGAEPLFFAGEESAVRARPQEPKRFALDRSGKIIVTDLRTEPEETAGGERKKSGRADFVTEIRYDGRNDAEMTMDFASGVYQNLSASDSQSAAAAGSDFQAMLANQIQQNAADFVRAGSIVLRDNDTGSIRLVLHPESLGNVKIDLQVSDKVITGHITVASQEAYHAFRESADSLRQAFMQSGFDTAGFDVSMAGQNASSGNSFGGQQDDSAARYGMIRNYGGLALSAETEPDGGAAELLSVRNAVNIVA